MKNFDSCPASPCAIIPVKQRRNNPSQSAKRIKLENSNNLAVDTGEKFANPWILDNIDCESIETYLNMLKSFKIHVHFSQLLNFLLTYKDNKNIFNNPVDIVALDIPEYRDIISVPMDLGTIKFRMSTGYYTTPILFIQDVELVFKNAMKFNAKPHPIYDVANEMLNQFHKELKILVKKFRQVEEIPHSCETCLGKTCYLCGEKCLKYSPFVIYCDGNCKQRILRNSYYYGIKGKKGRYCNKCITTESNKLSISERKRNIYKLRNDHIRRELVCYYNYK